MRHESLKTQRESTPLPRADAANGAAASFTNAQKPTKRKDIAKPAGKAALSRILSAILIALCAAFPLMFLHDPQALYESRAMIYVDAVHGATGPQGGLSADNIKTALSDVASVVNGQKLLDGVVQDLDLGPSLDKITPKADLLTGSIAADDGPGGSSSAPGNYAAKLRGLISLEPDFQTSVMTIAVRSPGDQTSADIANSIVDHLKAMNAVDQNKGHTLLDTLGAKVKQTEAALLDYQMANPPVQPDTDLQNEVMNIRSRLEDARQRTELLKKATAASALAGQFPSELASAPLDALLQDYSLLKLDLSQMSLKLGPRHPDLLAATKRADDIKASIGNEVSRIAKSVKKNFDDLVVAEKLVIKQAAQESESTKPATNDQLPALQKAVEDARSAYAAALLEPSRKTENVQRIRTVSKAVPAAQPLPAPLTDMLVPAGFGGLVGMVILGIVRTLRPHVNPREQGSDLPFDDVNAASKTHPNHSQDHLDDLVMAELGLASIPAKPLPAPGRQAQSSPVNARQGIDAEEDQASLEDMVRRLSALHIQLQALERTQDGTHSRNAHPTYRNAHESLTVSNTNTAADRRLTSYDVSSDDAHDLTLEDVRHAMRSIRQRVETYGRKQA